MWISHIAGRTAAATGIYFNQEFDKDRGHLLIPQRARTKEPDKKRKQEQQKQKRANTSYSQHACRVLVEGVLGVALGCTLIMNTVPLPSSPGTGSGGGRKHEGVDAK